jgi:hypothetical protein
MEKLTKLPSNNRLKSVNPLNKCRTTKICPVCGNEFEIFGPGNRKYCDKCRKKAQKEQIKKFDQEKIANRNKQEYNAYMRDLYHEKNTKNATICPNCKKPFLRINKRKTRYCEKCHEKVQNKQMRKAHQKERENRDKILHAENMQLSYHKNRLKKLNRIKGTTTVPAAPVKGFNTGGGVTYDWDAYGSILGKELKRLGLKTRKDYKNNT